MGKNEKKIVYNGDLFQLTSSILYSDKDKKIKVFEKAHRPPGVRMIFRKSNLIMLTREFRSEIDGWDYRLPGGKVFDEFISYSKFLNASDELFQKIKEAVILEAKQETGLLVEFDAVRLLYKSVVGSSVIWDLYYFEIDKFTEAKNGQELEEGEQIEIPVWKTFDEVKQMCLNGDLKEDRSVAVLLRYILNAE
ncbi:MAG: NUDIX domain-containing protein [Bacteroidetes bacterium]|nr:NUDIX domain-containing protein [Bacteroidota bacterium]